MSRWKTPVSVISVLAIIVAVAAGISGAFAQSNLPTPVDDQDFRQFPDAQIELGRLLFYDRVLSGTYRVSCATCHNHDRASSNGALLPEIAEKLAEDEMANAGATPYDQLKPSSRHAPALFNLGAYEFTTLFSDGRMAAKLGGGFVSPAGEDLPEGLRDVLAVQALFPAVTRDELTGTVENDFSRIAHEGNRAIWEAIAGRVRDLPEYIPLFAAAFPDAANPDEIDIASIANAISAFVATEWRSTNSPFDRYLAGDRSALSEEQKRGMALFYGEARCSACHSGPFQTDHRFHSAGMPPYDFETLGDPAIARLPRGRQEVTGDASDRDKVKTPSLRNVVLTAPYGHAGKAESLEDALMHHYRPVEMMRKAARRADGEDDAAGNARLLEEALRIAESSDVPAREAEQGEISDLIAFLHALTDEKSARGRLGKPGQVPSGLALD